MFLPTRISVYTGVGDELRGNKVIISVASASEMQSCYWRINYGPEVFQEETRCVARTIEKALEHGKRKGNMLDAAVFILRPDDPNPHDLVDVRALVQLRQYSTSWNICMLMRSLSLKHASFFSEGCRYDGLEQADYDQLTVEYKGKRL